MILLRVRGEIVETFTTVLWIVGLLIGAEVIYRVTDWLLFKANNLAGEMEEEE